MTPEDRTHVDQIWARVDAAPLLVPARLVGLVGIDIPWLLDRLAAVERKSMCETCSNYHAEIHHGCCANDAAWKADASNEIDRLEAKLAAESARADKAEAELARRPPRRRVSAATDLMRGESAAPHHGPSR